MAKPLAQMPYETVGDLALTFPAVDAVENYRRDLDLATATAHVSYTTGGVTFSREVFASAPDQVIVMRLTASRPGRSHSRRACRRLSARRSRPLADGDLVMRGVNGDGPGTTADGRPMTGALRFEARVRVLPTGGTRAARGDAMVVRDADAVTLLIAAATSYRNYEDVSADPAARGRARRSGARRRKSVDTLRAAHVRDYQTLFNRVTLDLGLVEAPRRPTSACADLATAADPGLAALYFQYGRYLLICELRAGSQPANLQGLWNDSMSPPWGSKYTININTEMNYWPALSTNLAETMEPLMAMVVGLVRDRRAHGARDVRRRRLGGASQHRSLARDRADRRPALGHVADRRGMADAAAVGSLRVQRRPRLPAAHLPAAQGRGAVLPRHAGRGADAPVAGDLTVALAREPASLRHVA